MAGTDADAGDLTVAERALLGRAPFRFVLFRSAVAHAQYRDVQGLAERGFVELRCEEGRFAGELLQVDVLLTHAGAAAYARGRVR